jgi:hypothetical protein
VAATGILLWVQFVVGTAVVVKAVTELLALLEHLILAVVAALV